MSQLQNIYNHGNIDDLLFLGKNKAYGAYYLRSTYEERIKKSFLTFFFAMTSITISTIIYQNISSKIKPEGITIHCPTVLTDLKYATQPKLIEPLSQDKFKALPNQNLATDIHVPPKIEDIPVDNTLKTNADITKLNTIISDHTSTGEAFSGQINPTANGSGYGIEKTEDPLIFDVSEVDPEFPGGYEELAKYLQRKVDYPYYEKRNDIEGEVYINFVVNENGSISDVQLAKKDRASFNQNALEVIKQMPNWIPGMNSGHPIKVRVTIPIVFKLDDI